MANITLTIAGENASDITDVIEQLSNVFGKTAQPENAAPKQTKKRTPTGSTTPETSNETAASNETSEPATSEVKEDKKERKITLEFIREKAGELLQQGGDVRKATEEAITEFGQGKLSKIPEDKYEAFLNRLNEIK